MSAPAPRKLFASERAARFVDAAADVSGDQLRAAADVLRAIAAVDLDPLLRAMTRDSLGNPITITEQQRDAQATWSHAAERRDRAYGWARELDEEAARREGSEP